MGTVTASALLLLVDGRLPSGGHAHSGGIESAVDDGRVSDIASLAAFAAGRLSTLGLVDAALAFAACDGTFPPAVLEAEAAARCPSPAQRAASRAQGRGLLRAARRMWPSPALEWLEPGDAYNGYLWPVVLGIVARSAGLAPSDASLAAAQASISGPCWAAVRLLALDPFEVAAVLASLAGEVDHTARRGCECACAAAAASELPSFASPLLEISAEHHARSEVRLFAS
jgi:urease accessory protein